MIFFLKYMIYVVFIKVFLIYRFIFDKDFKIKDLVKLIFYNVLGVTLIKLAIFLLSFFASHCFNYNSEKIKTFSTIKVEKMQNIS
jgi:dolichyl-phosphate-mannose--protein O-mannosyl transferase